MVFHLIAFQSKLNPLNVTPSIRAVDMDRNIQPPSDRPGILYYILVGRFFIFRHWFYSFHVIFLLGLVDLPGNIVWMFSQMFLMEHGSLWMLFFFFTGHPITYREYFSLNRTTAELHVLQPISRDLYQRFTLIIKVNNNNKCNLFTCLYLQNQCQFYFI